MYLAHSANRGGCSDPLYEHLTRVGKRAAQFAGEFGAETEAAVAGFLHDLGKYGDRFQARLEGKEQGLDHWSAGANAILSKYQWSAYAAALAVQGHHIGLQHALPKPLQTELDLSELDERHPLNLRLSETNLRLLLDRLRGDGLDLPTSPGRSVYDKCSLPVAGMLDVRMLFSALVDADYIETEAHFQGDSAKPRRYRIDGPPLEPERAFAALQDHLRNRIRPQTTATATVNALRDALLDACIQSAATPQGIFTLAAPTGAGKTLAMLAFALRHAIEHELRRIVMVIPYLTIIEQTVRIYREVLAPQFGKFYVLEHHSLSGTRADERGSRDNEDPATRTARLLSENWDAPLIVTTSVQCLESLFANRPAACRKLHRLARSVILFDEVQTLPPALAVPTLAALSRLVERYQATVVFSTATQPAFAHLDREVRRYAPAGWRPKEIAPLALNFFGRVQRTRVQWNLDPRRSWDDISDEIAESERVLCVVNLKRHAWRLTELLRKREVAGLSHLSTSMCPAHREKVLQEVRRRLEQKRPCRLISTQCVEAGVDLDFPVVYRAFGPLEAIAQAAGRCNRNGALKEGLGEVRVFLPDREANDERLYPPGGYEQAADVTRILLRRRGPIDMDINDPALFDEYYRTLYDLTRNAALHPELEDALQRRQFEDTARLYRLIDQDSINVVVPYDPRACRTLRDRLTRDGRLTRAWVQAARPYAVNVFRPRDDAVLRHFLEPVPLARGEPSDDWFFHIAPAEDGHYDALLGLKPPEGLEGWFA